MNDPREFGEPRSYKITHDQELFNQVMFAKKYSYVSCFAQDSTAADSSIRRGYEISSMWANYGGNHAGVCMVFDKSKLLKAFSDKFADSYQICHGSINYDAKRTSESIDVNLADQNTSESLETRAVKFLEEYWWYLKDPDWKHEREYRLTIGVDENIESSYIYLPLEDSVVGVCCGSKVSLHRSNFCLLKESATKLGVARSNRAKISWSGYQADVLPIGVFFPGEDKRCLAKCAIERSGLSLPAFAERVDTPVQDVVDWIEGKAPVPGTASILLKLICNHPELVNDYAFSLPRELFYRSLDGEDESV